MKMSDSALRAPSINLDEFERRLRAAGSLGGAQEDPLAELSRLLGLEEPSEEHPVAQAHPASPSANLGASAERASEQFVSPPEPAFAVDEAPELAASGEAPPSLPGARRPLAPQNFEGRSRRPRATVWVMAVLVAVGAAGAGAAWVYRLGVPGLQAKLPPLIMAAEGPTKVQPPSQDTVSSPNDVTSLLAKDQPGKGASVNVVSNAEQPVDLAVQSKAQASAEAQSNAPSAEAPTIAAAPLVVVTQPSSAGATPAPSSATATGTGAPAATTSAPSEANTSAANAQQPASIAPVSPEPPTPFPQPKRVKTVSVRPDGTVIASSALPSDDALSSAAAPPLADVSKPGLRPATSAADAEPATPKLDLPAKPAKSTARVPVNKTDTTAATASGQSPEGPLQIAPTAQHDAASKKTRVADAASASSQGNSTTPTNSSPPTVLPQDSTAGQPSTKPPSATGQSRMVRLAAPAADQANAPAASGGGTGEYAVQLAAPGSEAEAQTVSTHLKAKFASELGGADPVIRKADLEGGRTVYRVRVVGLAKADAVSLCEKLKAGGGACFIAKE
jgi:SPOR domain